MHERLTARPKAAPAPVQTAALTVTQLTAQIDRAIKAGLPAVLLVRGEVSNFTLHRASGHLYFTLKDEKNCIDCVMFAREAAGLKFTPNDGTEILVTGRIGVYGARGRYQVYATRIEPIGQGALELKFRQLKEKLEKEGLFDPDRKKPLPQYPAQLAIVTSRETAALQDMLKVLRLFPWIKTYLHHVPVQGEGAANKIAAAIDDLSRNAKSLRLDLILLARGGGSLEDLWQFNEEAVARAMARCALPIVTGIGHEVDVSIADLIADYHAHTPTEAARVVTAPWKQAGDVLDQAGVRLRRQLRAVVNEARQRLNSIERHEVFRRPTDRINALRQLLDERQRQLAVTLGERLRREGNQLARLAARFAERHPRHLVMLQRARLTGISARIQRDGIALLQRQKERVESLRKHLEAIGPLNVLNRGYTITSVKKDGAIVRSADQLKGGELIVTRFKDGTRQSIVEDPRQPKLFE